MIIMLTDRCHGLHRIFLFVLIGVAGCNAPDNQDKTTMTGEKTATAKPMLTDLDGRSINLQQFKGKTIFLNFWATWCKPCIYEMPSIKNAQDKLSKADVVFLLASNENADEIREFEKMYNYNFNYLKVVNLEELGVEGLPTTYIFNPRGELVFSETGYRKWDDSTNIEMILKINDQK